MAVLYNIKTSDWNNTQYHISQGGNIYTENNPAVLSCEIETTSLEEGTTVFFPLAEDDYSASIIGIGQYNLGEILSNTRSISQNQFTYELESDFTEKYERIAIIIENNTADTPVSSRYVSGIVVKLTDMYFRKSDLRVWVSRQDMLQFENMYPDIVSQSYQMALGNVYAQIGNDYDLGDLLAITNESEKDPTLLWILKVYTAYTMCSSSMNISEPLRANFEQAATALRELKGGQVSMIDNSSKIQEDGTRNYIVSLKNKYLG